MYPLVGDVDNEEGYACVRGHMGKLCTFLSILL